MSAIERAARAIEARVEDVDAVARVFWPAGPGLMGWEGVVLSAAAFLRRVENDPAVQDAMLAALVRAGRLREQRKSSTQMRRCDGGIACAVTSGQATIGANPPPGAGYTHYHIDVPIGRRARLVTEWREVAE